MNEELFANVTIGDLVYLGSAILMGLVLSLVTRLISNRLKDKLRKRARTNIGAQLVDDMDGTLALWIVVGSVYLGLLGLPPLGDYLSALQRGFTVVSILLVVYAGIRVQRDAIAWTIRRIGRRTGQAKVLNSLVPVSKQIASIGILAMGVLVILDQLGISIAPLVAGMGISGLAVALALQGTLTNFFAGLNVMTDGSIREGDFVGLDSGMIGTVEQIGWRSTRIRLLANNMVMIPNSKLADNVSINYNYPVEEMSVYLQVGVAYSSDLNHVERVTVEVAKKVLEETPGAVREFEPSIWYTDFGDSNINFWVVLRADGYLDSWLVQHNFVKALSHRYNEEGIEISFPARNIFMRNGATEARLTEGPRKVDAV
ncbi:mechanosensitive ion channel family protein [SAR202 cluster bacterium AC-647-N09_OGT_505m]|nr:mechanosensitive ion channel family protein [SAR202 cluster bacterium AC-647-N09_OGT_505m]